MNITSTAGVVHAVKHGYAMRSACGDMRHTATKMLTSKPVDCPECLALTVAPDDNQALDIETRTWANGWGLWHASLPTLGCRGCDASIAEQAIAAEREQREGPNFDAGTVRVKLLGEENGRVTYCERIED